MTGIAMSGRTGLHTTRLAALLQTSLLVFGLLGAPTFHRAHCGGACSSAQALAPSASPAEASCHGAPAGAREPESDCQCLDDCCSLVAQFVAPTGVADAGPQTPVSTSALAPAPDESRRAPDPRLLPYPTGPPTRI